MLAAHPMTGWLRVPCERRAELARIVDGSLDYVLSCTALRVGPGEVCIVTDHRILPLSWTRDAYYQAALLLAAGHEPRAAPTVHDHLRWLWGRSRDEHGSWMRSHLTNGQVKDPGLQADQQLYPVLELCDYRRVTGEWPAGYDWASLVAEAWAALCVDPRSGLVAGEENPADDPSRYPFTLSTQILYWHTATRLGELGLDADPGPIRAAVDEHFTVDGPFGPQWAYETDARGHHRLYNDANDLPTALAPLWGFCPPTDPRWAATMRYTFSSHNPAYRTGPYGGLGSAHTSGTWPLGDVQEWVAASLLGQPAAADAAVHRLCRVAAPDGLLPEAYDPATGRWLARPWFAWPGAAAAVVYLTADGAGPWLPTRGPADHRGGARGSGCRHSVTSWPAVQTYPKLRQVVLDTTDARALAEFYRQLLGLRYRAGDEPPPAGEPDPAGHDWLVLQDAAGRAQIAFQQVATLPEATWPSGPIPQQAHLDLTVPTAAELDSWHDRVLGLGARLLHDRTDESEEPLRVYADPAGHPFCIFVGDTPG